MGALRSTRTRIGNGSSRKSAWITWTEDEDGLGWKGQLTFWKDPDTRDDNSAYDVEIRQGMPLGYITVLVEPSLYGCWSMTGFEGVGITERDLQWAAAFAVEALKRKRERDAK